MLNKPKGVIANEAYEHTDDFITRTYVMPLLFDDQSRRRLIAERLTTWLVQSPKCTFAHGAMMTLLGNI